MPTSLINHVQAFTRGACGECGQSGILGWWSADRKGWCCCACHDALDTEENKMTDDEEYMMDDALAAAVVATRLPPDAITRKFVAVAQDGGLIRHSMYGVQFWADPLNRVTHGVGAHLWFAARALTDYLLGQGACAPGSRCCEVGAGCGGVGLVLHAKTNCSVKLTDMPHVVPLLRFNAAHVGPAHDMACVAPLEWSNETQLADVAQSRYDVVFGSDVVYDADQHAALLRTLATLAQGPRRAAGAHDGAYSDSTPRARPARVVLAIANRPDGTLDDFLALAARCGWTWAVACTAVRSDADVDTFAISSEVVLLEGTPPPS